MRKLPIVLGALVPIAMLAGVAVFVAGSRHGTAAKPKRDPNPLHLPQTLVEQRDEADRILASGHPKEAIAAYAKVVAAGAPSKDPNVQDQVARARIRMGYQHAKLGDFAAARKVFLEAESQFKGTKAMDPEFGGLPDQAAYQAAVCLVAQGKKDEAADEFRALMRGKPLSPLVYASFRRLQRLAGGDPNKGDEDLLQKAIGKQEANMRFEIVTCGPKTIAYLLPRLGLPARDYKDIAKISGTNDYGTSMEGMRKALKSFGIETTGLLVNRKDLATVKTPAILLEHDHFVTLLSVSGDAAQVYDTRYRTERTIQLPPEDDKSFTAAVIVLRDVKPASNLRK